MKTKLIWALITLVLIVLLFEVVFRPRTVAYMGENKDWQIRINAKLVGLNGSYNIEVRYKGKEPPYDVYFNILLLTPLNDKKLTESIVHNLPEILTNRKGKRVICTSFPK